MSPPVPVPPMSLVRDDGVSTTFSDLVRGRVTAVQAMFTRCTTTCPIEGAIFARVQDQLSVALRPRVQLVSLSMDPEHDDPEALTSWVRRFHRRPGWVAASPPAADVERLRDFLGRGRDPADNHATQVLIVDRAARAVWRTGKLPSAEEIVALLGRAAST